MDDNLVKYEIPIYGGEFWVAFADDFVDFAKKYGIELKFSANNCNGLSLKKYGSDIGMYIMMIKNDKVRPDIIAHESLHIVNYIFEDRGVIASIEQDEHQAYLMDWVVEQSFMAAIYLGKQLKVRFDNKEIPLTYIIEKSESKPVV